MSANNGTAMTPVLIMTRPAPQSETFAEAIVSRWGGPLRVIISPLIAIKPVRAAVDLSTLTDVIFTSVNGVAAGAGLRIPAGSTAWCVGSKTAKSAERAGFVPVVGPGDADGLAQLIIARAPKGAIAHVRGRHSRGAISTRLNDAGIACVDVVAYDQTACPLTVEAQNAVKGKEPVLFPLFSPRTATILSKQGPFAAPVHLVMMSKAVAQNAKNIVAVTEHTATRPDEAAMIAATLQSLRGLTHGRG